jgi:hypothetical protein
MIAGCHDENNHITIPGFYDDVVEATAEERKKMAQAPFNEKEYSEDLGVSATYGAKKDLRPMKGQASGPHWK